MKPLHVAMLLTPPALALVALIVATVLITLWAVGVIP